MISATYRHYALQLLLDVGFLGCKPASTPMKMNLKLSLDDGETVEDSTLLQENDRQVLVFGHYKT